MASEIELKLALEPSGLRRVARLPAVSAVKSGRAKTALLSSTYYDTPDLALAGAGITVRLRAVGPLLLQTVKTAGQRAGGLFSRGEWEQPIHQPNPDPTMLRATGIDILTDSAVLDRLRPVFTTSVTRTTHRLVHEQWEVELALDQGAVTTDTARQAISEAELELVRGDPSCLFDLGRKIVAALPARLLTVSKSDRGYELATGAAPQPVKAVPMALTRAMSTAQAFQAIARNCLHQLLVNERSLSGANAPEAVHQMRVALRRLRSAVKLFRPVVAGPQLDTAKQEIRWLLSHLGPARDSHVFVAEIIDPVVGQYPGNPALTDLRSYWLGQHELHQQEAAAAVGDRRFTALVLDLAAWVEAGDWLDGDRPDRDQRLKPFAAAVLGKAIRRMRKAGGNDLAKLPPEHLHQVRILGKQVRYAGEFFISLFPTTANRRFLGLVADLQDVLGQINDIAVAGPKLEAGSHDGPTAWAAGLITGWHSAQRPALMTKAGKIWTRQHNERPFREKD